MNVVKYLLLIYSNAESWDAMSTAQRRRLGKGHADLRKELTAAGTQIGGEGLSDEVNSKTVRVRDSKVVVTDGPYIESKEHLAGYYLVECADIDEASAIAARIPDAAITFVEVRPVMELE